MIVRCNDVMLCVSVKIMHQVLATPFKLVNYRIKKAILVFKSYFASSFDFYFFLVDIVINNVKSLTDAEFATAVINWQKKRYDCLKKREQRKQAKNRRTVRSQSPDDE